MTDPYRITIIGMSGVGKTRISSILAEAGWVHYSSDYHIGSHYLEKDILNVVEKEVQSIPSIQKLMDNGTLSLEGKVSIDNIELVSNFIAQIGNPEQDGLSLKEFTRRLNLYYEAEIQSAKDTAKFIEEAGDKNFIHDSSGSLCHLPDDVIENLAKITRFVYIEATEEDEKTLIDRARAYPKPLFYPVDFLQEALDEYMKLNDLEYIALIDPDDFRRWVFPKLFYSRVPKYKQMACKYGITISSDDVKTIENEADVIRLMNAASEQKRAS